MKLVVTLMEVEVASIVEVVVQLVVETVMGET